MRLLSSEGELVVGRCKATNLCPYCQRLYVAETVEMLVLDAVEFEAPTVWVVLTAREHLTRAQLSEQLRHLRRAARRRWPGIRWFVEVEFQRRGALHANLLVKGVDGCEAAELLRVLTAEWCKRVDALPVGQWAEAVGAAEVIAKYLGKMLGHGLKAEQAPPLGWRGHRTSHSREYFALGTTAMRQRAKESLQRRRALERAVASGLNAHDAELGVVESMRVAASSTWVLANVRGVRLSKARAPEREAHWELYRAIKEDRLVRDVVALGWRQWTGWDAADSLAEYRYRRASDEWEAARPVSELATLF